MKNAHLRFGWLTYYKRTDKTTTTFKLRLDRFIGEVLPEAPRRGKAHLISVVGGDTQIAAVNAAISTDEDFEIEGPNVEPVRVSLGRNAQTNRASLQLRDRKRSLRHLVGISEELINNTGSTGRTILAHSQPDFLWMSIAKLFGLPGTPEWAGWFCDRLEKQRAIVPLLGIGCDPVLIKGDKTQFLSWLAHGVQSGMLPFPGTVGRIEWQNIELAAVFQHATRGSREREVI
ncbi:MAG TPA: hypothetical protein VGK01_07185 [Candidatus Angelobacter sp.]|jgi:hypothetical protein